MFTVSESDLIDSEIAKYLKQKVAKNLTKVLLKLKVSQISKVILKGRIIHKQVFKN